MTARTVYFVGPTDEFELEARRRGYRRTAPSPTSDGFMSASTANDLSYNVLLDGTATHNFGKDLTSRFDTRYTYEDQESNGVSASGSTRFSKLR